MSIRSIQSPNTDALSAQSSVQTQKDIAPKAPTVTPVEQQRNTPDPNASTRLSQQFMRGRMSIGNAMIQQKLSSQLKQVDSLTAKTASPVAAQTAATATAKTVATPKPLGAEKIRVNVMPESTPAPLVAAIKSAQTSVDVSVYYFNSPTMTQALKDAAARGVKVRVMLEPIPVGITKASVQAKADELRAAGVQVEDTPPEFTAGTKVDHAKFMIIDNKELLYGTGNFATSGLGEVKPNYDGPQTFNRDFWVEDTRSQSISEAHSLFDADWNRTDTKGINFKNLVVTPDNGSQKIIDMIDNTKTRLYIYNQSINDPAIMQHIVDAKKRGVDVKVIVAAPRSDTDKNIITRDQFTAAGIPTGMYHKNVLHAKAMIADDKVFLGSQNFTSGGLYNNREFGEIFQDPAITNQMLKTFDSDFRTTGVVTGDKTIAAGKVKVYAMPEAGSYPIIAAINSATKSVDLEVYQLTESGVTDALKLAAQRGVQVRVMLEPKIVGDGNNFEAKAAELRAAGVNVKETPPEFDSNNNVDHAKFMVIDGRDLLFGTGNLVKSGLGQGVKAEFNNRDFWVEDARKGSVGEASQVFEHDWNRQSTSDIKFKSLTVTPDNSSKNILNMIDSAKTRLYIYNQELYDQNMVDHIVAAKARGVDVHVLLADQKESTPFPGNITNKQAIDQLKAAGVTAAPFNRYYLHAKGVVADDKAFLGSQNFSSGGLIRNREFGEVFSSKDVVEQLAKRFLADEAYKPTPAPPDNPPVEG